ncbi:MAG: bifunctional protein-serine/threonine kinase/phosphatase [Nitrospirae bacterium]|nr:bifunctional protein-serine/threonine kinase/phosphatase [Nitrospirota bacterium]
MALQGLDSIEDRASGLAVLSGGESVPGRRETNEDFYGLILPKSAEVLARKGILAVVADGLGGHAGGHIASQVAVQMILEDYYGTPDTWPVKKALAAVIRSASRWIHEEGKKTAARGGMATTLSVLCLKGSRYTVAHVGDSAVFLARGGAIARLTEPHVWSKSGGGERVVTRALGLEDDVRIDFQEADLAPGDAFVLATDGVTGTVRPPELLLLHETHADPEEFCRAVTDLVVERGGEDNATVQKIVAVSVPSPFQESLSGQAANLPFLLSLREGMVADGYRLERRIAKGGMGSVYAARDMETGLAVVIKFPNPLYEEDAEYRECFLREAWLARQVNSPWIVRPAGPADRPRTAFYSVFEALQGRTLRQALSEGGRMSTDDMLDVAEQVCFGLIHLHRKEIVHRDVKPDNVFLLDDGSVKLLDLGLARAPGLPEAEAGRARPDRETALGAPGTANYIAPERYRGEPGDKRADVFSLGVSMYEMLTGRYPYGDLFDKPRPRFGEPAPPSRYVPSVPLALEKVILKAVAADPARRHRDASELLFELKNLDRVPLDGTGQGGRERDPALPWKIAFLVAAGVAVALGAFLAMA